MDIATWIGNLLGQLPGWAAIPGIILLIIISAIAFAFWAFLYSDSWPFARKSEFLEKTASKKKGKHGKK